MIRETRFSITIDESLWHRVSIAAAKACMTKRAYLEQALREKLEPQHWRELPAEIALAIEGSLGKDQIIHKGQDYLLAVIVSDGDGPEAAAYCWRNGYPAEFATGSREEVRELVEEEIRSWEVSWAAKGEAVDKLHQILNSKPA